MRFRSFRYFLVFLCTLGYCLPASALAASGHSEEKASMGYPYPLDYYISDEIEREETLGRKLSLKEILSGRIHKVPFNLVASLIFFMAVCHAFLVNRFNKIAHRLEAKHRENLANSGKHYPPGKEPVSFSATLFHFLGEVEAIFGIWIVPLLIAFTLNYDWESAFSYVNSRNFTEAAFVIVIMSIASTKPIVSFAEKCLKKVAALGRGTPAAWWFSILSIGPLMGSFITEPAAMTISAVLLSRYFYIHKPSVPFCYATLGLLFVNVSVGGTLTHFAAPPVLIVSDAWNWGVGFMFATFGWKAIVGILISNLLYFAVFAKEFKALGLKAAASETEAKAKASPEDAEAKESVPIWIVGVHLAFMAWTVFTLHFPVLFIIGFLFFVAFTQATWHHQYQLALRGPILVGFFLAGLVIHGGLQAWWIAPVLGSLTEQTLFFTTIALTAFNDNAAITFLASQVPMFDTNTIVEGVATLKEGAALQRAQLLQYAVVAGAVAGGGLTVIANAPNPAGQNILSKHFEGGISPIKLLLGSLGATCILALLFIFLTP